jgi:MraZ protein
VVYNSHRWGKVGQSGETTHKRLEHTFYILVCCLYASFYQNSNRIYVLFLLRRHRRSKQRLAGRKGPACYSANTSTIWKGRLAVPSRFREELGSTIVVTRGFDTCLQVFPLPAWEQLAERINNLSLGSEDGRNIRRQLFSQAADLEVDRQGRVLLPQNLRTYARLNEQVMIVGLSTYCEIWARDEWERVLNGLSNNSGSIAEYLSNLGI